MHADLNKKTLKEEISMDGRIMLLKYVKECVCVCVCVCFKYKCNWWAVVNIVMKLQVFLWLGDIWKTLILSGRTPLHGIC